jgi:hypothetical protein
VVGVSIFNSTFVRVSARPAQVGFTRHSAVRQQPAFVVFANAIMALIVFVTRRSVHAICIAVEVGGAVTTRRIVAALFDTVLSIPPLALV